MSKLTFVTHAALGAHPEWANMILLGVFIGTVKSFNDR